jgi:hypothetical protein
MTWQSSPFGTLIVQSNDTSRWESQIDKKSSSGGLTFPRRVVH